MHDTTKEEAARQKPGVWWRFLLTWLVGTCALLLAVAAFNVAVDPFFAFGTPLIAGFNRYKPATQGRETLAKVDLLLDARPRTLLMGTSKAQVGLDPDSPIWSAADKPVFNLGLPGRTSRANLRLLTDALAMAPVNHVLLLIEPIDLIERPGFPGPSAPFQKVGWARARELIDAALTRDALEASIRTVADQWTDKPSGLRPNGQMYDGFFRGPTELEGPGAVFGQKLASNADRVVSLGRRLMAKPDTDIAELDTLADIIALCRAHGVKLDLALAPLHAEFLRLLDLGGLWPRYLRMREELARTVAKAGDDQVRLWSFTGFNAYSEEPVPPAGQRTKPLRWFWEPNHFRPELGELMLQAIYAGRDGVGTVLTPDDAAAANQAETEALDRDKVAQPMEWARAAKALSEARERLAKDPG